MARRRDEVPLLETPPRRGAWAAILALAGVLLFTWPFVTAPPPGIGAAYAQLLGAWATVVGLLAILARAIGRDARAGGGGA